MIIYVILTSLLVLSLITDIHRQRIPNWLTCSAALLGIIHCSATAGIHGALISLAGTALGLALLLPFYTMGGMGAGDVKLMGAVGALIGPKAVFSAFLFTALVGGVYAVILLIVYGNSKETFSRYGVMLKALCCTGGFAYIKPTGRERRPLLRYGVAIALGTFLSIILKDMHV